MLFLFSEKLVFWVSLAFLLRSGVTFGGLLRVGFFSVFVVLLRGIMEVKLGWLLLGGLAWSFSTSSLRILESFAASAVTFVAIF